jgi:PAS domain S-box-containing protein
LSFNKEKWEAFFCSGVLSEEGGRMVKRQQIHQFSESHYQLAAETAGVGMWEWDLREGQSIWNTRCREMFGYPAQSDISSADVLSRVHPADRERVEHLLSESLRHGTAYDTEFRVVWPDGSLHWVAARGEGIIDANGTVFRLVSVLLDITIQKRSQELERAVGGKIQTILESVTDALSHVDHAERLTYINAQAEQITNLPREQVLGRVVWEVFPELVGSCVQHSHRQVMQTRQPAQCEFYNPRLHAWGAFHFYPALDGGVTVLIQDITMQKSLEHERDQVLAQERAARIEAESAHQRSQQLVTQLEHEQAFLRTVMEQAPSAMAIAEAPSGKLLLSNQAAHHMIGPSALDSKDYKGYARAGAIHQDGTAYKAEEYPLARALLRGEVIKQEPLTVVRGDNDVMALEVSAAPIRDAQGTIIAAVCIFHDITERHELEKKKDAFIRMASHELRTPLTSLKGNLQLLDRRLQRWVKEHGDLLSPEARMLKDLHAHQVEPALRQANVEDRLIDDLLDAASIRLDTLSVVLEPENLVEIVSEAVQDLHVVAGGHLIYLERPEQSDILVMADRVRIGEVVTNLVRNALKYSGEGQPVTVGISLQEGEARVWVKDLGPGLSKEAQRQIWDRFSPLSGFGVYQRQGGGGLGLGLYISQALVRAHGGHMGVESEPGKGAKFWFTLLLKRS